MLDVWPSLPIEIMQMGSPYDGKSVIAALEHRDRVRDLYIFSLTSSLLGTTPCAETPSAFFPSETVPALPDMFLGGSAPRLQSLTPNNIPFQGLPRLLLFYHQPFPSPPLGDTGYRIHFTRGNSDGSIRID